MFSGLSNSIKEKEWKPTCQLFIKRRKIDSLNVSSRFVFTDWISNNNKTSLILESKKNKT